VLAAHSRRLPPHPSGRGDCDALLLDLRGNAGGAVSDLVVQRLTQRQLATELPPHGRAHALPEHCAPPLLLVLIDEHTCSDAEVVAHNLAAAAGATLVGARTWGGVFAMGLTELLDGTSVSHPSYALRTSQPIENRGVEPHVLAEVAPHDAARGIDALLDAATAKMLALMQERARAAAASGAQEADAHLQPQPRAWPHWSVVGVAGK
jgi:tricorn protease